MRSDNSFKLTILTKHIVLYKSRRYVFDSKLLKQHTCLEYMEAQDV